MRSTMTTFVILQVLTCTVLVSFILSNTWMLLRSSNWCCRT